MTTWKPRSGNTKSSSAHPPSSFITRGHNGVKSIYNVLGTNQIQRLLIGIGRPDSKEPDVVSDYVLGQFTHFEKQQLRSVFDNIISDEIVPYLMS